VDFDFGSQAAEWVVSAKVSLHSGPVCSHMPINFEAQSVNAAEPSDLHIFAYPLFTLYGRPFLSATYNNIIMESHLKIEQYPLAYVAADISRMRRRYKYYWIVPAPRSISLHSAAQGSAPSGATTATDDDCGKRM